MESVCPACHFKNFPGEERCTQCLHSLMQRELPKPRKEDAYQNAMMTAPIEVLITGNDLLVANKTDSVKKVSEVLSKEKKDAVLIYEKKKLVGIVSVRDLLKKASGGTFDVDSPVGNVMTPWPEAVGLKDPIAFAVNKMAMGGFRHVPVLAANGAPVTIVSIKDVLNYLAGDKPRSAS